MCNTEFGRVSELGKSENGELKTKPVVQTPEEKIVERLLHIVGNNNRTTVRLIQAPANSSPEVVGRLISVTGKGANAVLKLLEDGAEKTVNYKDIDSISGGCSTAQDGLGESEFSSEFSMQVSANVFACKEKGAQDGLG